MQTTYVGLDDGHDGIKIVFNDNEGLLRKFRLPSIAQVKKGNLDLIDVNTKELEQSIVEVTNEGVETSYLVSENLVNDKDDTRTSDYPFNDLNIALIYQALRLANVSNEADLVIVSGLPANRYFNKAEGNKNQDLIDKKIASLKNINRADNPTSSKVYHANDIYVLPEGYGIAWDLMFADTNLKATEYFQDFKDSGCVVIDIGGRTVDVVKVMAKSCLPKGSDLQSFDKGILFLKDRVRTGISERIGGAYSLDDNIIDKAFATGWVGRAGREGSYEVSDIIEKLTAEYIEAIYRDIRTVLNSNEAFGGVILAGGGSYLLGEKLKKRIADGEHKTHIILIDEPEFSNAKGFWKIARSKNQKAK